MAITSTSTFTGSPGPLRPSVVTSAVWGMMAKLTRPPPRATIVRLTPSMAIEPYSTQKRSSASGMATTRSGTASTTSPTAST